MTQIANIVQSEKHNMAFMENYHCEISSPKETENNLPKLGFAAYNEQLSCAYFNALHYNKCFISVLRTKGRAISGANENEKTRHPGPLRISQVSMKSDANCFSISGRRAPSDLKHNEAGSPELDIL